MRRLALLIHERGHDEISKQIERLTEKFAAIEAMAHKFTNIAAEIAVIPSLPSKNS
jgi:hypothetical protein